MTVKNKKILILVFLTGCVLLGYWLWLSLRPVEVVAVHDNGNHSYVLVRNFPLTDKGKINWWLKNKDILEEKYDIPKPSSSGYFTVIFWDFGDGYKEEGKYDRLCFDDMKTKVNCIEKDAVFSVDESRNMGVMFTVYDGDNYRLDHNGDIIKVASD
ncbi:DUF943 family protein [Rosenbergiella sp. S61]|uniref:DUF943 family protein n=1 Tax=Rosenbergiella gaditana TaxID=2726987 RepID=A0ABS5SWU1_9GAMM|nr:DUF943 family protein [Rosenbergiella gaditana]MBT0723948.1 DUF943 family protein [Rosenbergiella gaditana]